MIRILLRKSPKPWPIQQKYRRKQLPGYKITDAKVAQEKKDANTEALAEIDGRLISVSNALIQATGTDKGPLDQKLKEAQQAKTEQDGKELASGGYKELFEEDKKTSGYFGIAENDNGSGQQEN